jgi:hypothetical protein
MPASPVHRVLVRWQLNTSSVAVAIRASTGLAIFRVRRARRRPPADRGWKSDGDASVLVSGGLRRALIPFGVAVVPATINVIATLLTTK